MKCSKCNNHQNNIIDDICFKCRLKEILKDNINPCFINNDIINFVIIEGSEIKSPLWFYNSSNSWKNKYINVLKNIDNNNINIIHNNIFPVEYQKMKIDFFVQLKRIYYPNTYRELFNPRKEGKYKDIFEKYEKKIDILLSKLYIINGNFKECEICGIKGNKNFVYKIDLNICLPCILKIYNLSQWLEYYEIKIIENKYKYDYSQEIILYIKGNEIEDQNMHIISFLNKKRIMYTTVRIDNTKSKVLLKEINKWNYKMIFPCLIVGKNHICGNNYLDILQQLEDIMK